jgi:hypothetical protein
MLVQRSFLEMLFHQKKNKTCFETDTVFNLSEKWSYVKLSLISISVLKTETPMIMRIVGAIVQSDRQKKFSLKRDIDRKECSRKWNE